MALCQPTVLKLNIEKTNYVSFHFPRKKTDKDITLCLDNKSVSQAAEVGEPGGALAPPIIWLGGPGPLNNNLAKNSNFF